MKPVGGISVTGFERLGELVDLMLVFNLWKWRELVQANPGTVVLGSEVECLMG